MTVTLTTLLADVRERLDETTANYWNDIALTRWLNEALKDIAKRSETLLAKGTVNAVGGTGTYTLPADAVRIHLVEFVPTGSTQTYPVKVATRQSMENVWGLNQGQLGSYPYFYVPWGFVPNLQMQVFPVPAGAGTFNVWYYRLPAALANPGDVAEIPAGWEDLIPLYVEALAKRKDHDPTWNEAMSMYEERLKTMSEQLRHLHDQQEYITSASGIGVPAWLYSFDDF